ncbi:class D beta-lactamase [Pseudalkalibacillus decolorationis]|uniref:class D beta-lactamase n=1 Tax=Pseudalkalibacillus decolorationis TaxID=163879 RepID=UPI002148DDFB|nr:class D beta-lactamase [Pseudalkalibacillus decolorationis]
MKKLRFLTVSLLLIGTLGLSAIFQTPDEAGASEKNLNVKKLDVDEFFSDHEGTFILRDMKKGRTFVYNQERADQRLTPESTFKVPNALIGLQVEAVQDEYDIKYWDGVEREIEIWNQDHTLGSGMRHSVIWYYQAMARDIGEDRMEEWVQKISYGNQDISGGIDQFWLDSSLKITPLEQTEFMENLYKETLPFDKNVMNTVKQMMIQKEGDDYTLYGKTGTRLSDLGLGWYAGFIETKGRDYVFVTNVAGTGTTAKNITLDILEKYHIIAD